MQSELWKKAETYYNKYIGIPILKIIFLVMLFFNLNKIDISFLLKWIPINIINLFVQSYDHIFDNIIFLIILGVIVSTIVYILGYFNVYPKDEEEYRNIDGTMGGYNYISAIQRIISLFIWIFTDLWIVKFIINTISKKWLDFSIVDIDSICLAVNIIILIFIFKDKLYSISYSRKLFPPKIEYSDIFSLYIILNKVIIENVEYFILKDNFVKDTIYILIKVRNKKDEHKKYVRILNQSTKFDEIRYMFDNLEVIHKDLNR
ncbi:hypothetical protein [uncultured Granulicatella sp.]|uniref:hypothetical protein n=1 Tax=uncultured Granulicatella sp. TaxID=316089 RepID=UPI0028DC4F1E|nr:hypothetical protein [uncultured Granulicatella sp.]